MKKYCKHCQEEKPLSEFSPHVRSKLGVREKCKKCSSLEGCRRYASNPRHYAAAARRYRKDNPEAYAAISKKHRERHPERRLLDGCRYRAKKKGLLCTITAADLVVPEYCPALKIKLEFAKVALKDNSPSVDRKVPALGYVRGNVRVISYKANRMKNNATITELKQLIEFLEK